MAGQSGEPLLDGSLAAESAGAFGCVDCSRLLVWRAEGSDRRRWKAFCTCCWALEFLAYFHIVRGHVVLTATGALTLVKGVVEIWGQETPNWVCPGGPVVFFLIYFLILPGVIYYDGACSQNPDMVFAGSELVGLALFLFGSGYSLRYEVHRFRWKKETDGQGTLVNQGKLHTIGLAAYCGHPNYFGDLFTYTGWALCAGTTCALSLPAYMLWSFVLIVIPNSDAYLAKKYAAEWPAYAAKTAPLVPLVRSSAVNQVLGWIGFAAGCYLSTACAGQCG